ncbi:MAG: hypothetical protein Q7U38_08940 [Methylobacter sp.]|nr:hypothetical protein [Methylobacter sp.]MDP2099852.1 hypothetical protein [Methylobacter sp.]MDP2429295.1 hypothetical protein [Methylobacter sp.]MDP3055767.1 hypothetical protein [Methylobacter sp.]MDP3363689.1 hypothetical protein [Methylobacter sp.]
MKKILIAITCCQIIGCASLKYPNWEQVNIETSVINKPCESKLRIEEQCYDDDCKTWFKKRATIYGANTVVRHGNSASYFYCATGLAPYQNPMRVTTLIDIRNDVAYFPNESKPFTGKHETYYLNGKKNLSLI